MRIVRLAGLVIFGLSLLAAGAAHAGSQNICAKLSLSGFNNSSIVAGYRVTDVGASVHQCTPGNSTGCSACAGATFQPKNVGNYLCLPSNLLYSISSSCQSLLNSGANNNCNENNNVGTCYSGYSVIKPACNWRTNDNDNEADWSWSLSVSNGMVIVNCSTTNYQGYTQ